MAKHQSRTRAPGDEDLPDLAINMPLQQAHPNPQVVDRLSVDLRQRNLLHYKTAQDARPRVPIDEGRRTPYRGTSTSFKPKVHPGRGFDLGLDTKAHNNDSVAWPTRKSSTCASCSKRSLACVHAAALNAFDEHDSGSDSDFDDRHAARLTLQPILPQNKHVKSHGATRRSQTYTSTQRHTPPQTQASPMLQRWLGQSPHQEGFNGIATAEVLSAGAMKSHL